MVKGWKEEELIAACLRGNQHAWQELYQKYHLCVIRTVSWAGWSFTKSEQEELVQDVFLELINTLPNFRMDCSLFTFLAQIAKGKCISLLRKKTAQKRKEEIRAVSLENLEQDGNYGSRLWDCGEMEPLDMIISQEEIFKLKQVFESLSSACKEILNLRYIHEKSYEQLCHDLELPLGTVCSRLKRCIIAFKKSYETFCSKIDGGVKAHGERY